MTASVAFFAFAVGIAGLFYLDRDSKISNSWGLWLPVVWLAIVGSRPVSVWLGANPNEQGLSQQMEGSPLDRFVFQILLVAGLVVLFRRRRTVGLLKRNWPILVYFAYGLVSIVWSDFPDVSFKRWIKAIGDLVMVLIVATEAEPLVALKRLLARTGFILLPMSVMLIKYSVIGRGYDPDGQPMNTGVTTNKNTLGVITLVLALGALWRVRMLLLTKDQPNRGRHLLAQGTLLAFGLILLQQAHSATSVASFALGAVLMFLTTLPVVKNRPRAVHVVVLLVVLAGATAILSGAKAQIVHAMGREENLTGRTDIWAAVLRGVDNPVLGAGFETFWLGPRLLRVWSGLSQYMHVNEAHNGYLEVYLNLGGVGVILLAVILITAYKRAVAAYRWNTDIGALMLPYVAAAVVYSISEAGFRMLNPIWICLLLAEVGSVGMLSPQRARVTARRPGTVGRTLPAPSEFWGVKLGE
jgi:exopolysaccharide production protein ExoQ